MWEGVGGLVLPQSLVIWPDGVGQRWWWAGLITVGQCRAGRPGGCHTSPASAPPRGLSANGPPGVAEFWK